MGNRLKSALTLPEPATFNRDGRQLGVAIRSVKIEASGYSLNLGHDASGLKSGFHRPEPESGYRWTKRVIKLPDNVLVPFESAFEIAIEISCTAKYSVVP